MFQLYSQHVWIKLITWERRHFQNYSNKLNGTAMVHTTIYNRFVTQRFSLPETKRLTTFYVMHAQENLYQKDRNFHVKPVFQESLYLTGIARGWAKYRDLLVASKSNYWQITIQCDNRGQQLFYHSITQFVFIFKSLSDSSRKRFAIFNVSPESVVFITHEQNIRELKHRRFWATDVNRKSRLLLFDVYFTLLIQKFKL